MLFLFTKYRSLTLLSFESFHIGLVREVFTPRQSTVNEAARGIRRSIPMMLCGLLSNLLCLQYKPSQFESGSTLPLTSKIDWYETLN
jgi:hypothetical protein